MEKSRNGITLLEVLVILGVLGLLAAILLPAVQRSRAVSRRLTCTNQLRQLSLAAQQYHEVFGHIPNPLAGVLHELFPFLELAPHYGLPGVDVYHRALLCPEDSLHEPHTAPFSYFVNWGGGRPGMAPGPWFSEGMVKIGVDILQINLAFRDVLDGLSNTALFSERRADRSNSFGAAAAPYNAACLSDPVRCVWHLADWPDDHEAFVRDCANPALRISASPGGWGHGKRFYYHTMGGGYFHVHPPNQPSCYRNGVLSYQLSASSDHIGGVNLALCDGAVRFVSDRIGLHTWWALGTRDNADIVGEF